MPKSFPRSRSGVSRTFVHRFALLVALSAIAIARNIHADTSGSRDEAIVPSDAALDSVPPPDGPPPRPPAVEPAVTPEPPTVAPSLCELGPYLEPSAFVAVAPLGPRLIDSSVRPGLYLNRIASGVLARRCPGSATLRLGATAYVAGKDWGVGAGLETEIDLPVTRRLELGGRLGVEVAHYGPTLDGLFNVDPYSAKLITVGARLHIHEVIPYGDVVVGLDVFDMVAIKGTTPTCDTYLVPGCTSHKGVMVGVGLSGRAGAGAVVAEIAAVLVAAGLVLAYAYAYSP